MFCPKCGGENAEGIAFCRACGENLKIISQVMKGHAPVAIISKLDAVIERKNERLRRDAIWWGLCGAIASVWTYFAGSLLLSSTIPWLETLGTFVLPVVFFLLSGWKYLAFRRSLELRAPPAPSTNLQSGAYPPIFCHSCGRQNDGTKAYCSFCGSSLNFGPVGMEKYLPGFIVRRLDQTITRNENVASPYKSGWRVIIVALSMFMFAAQQWSNGSFGLMALYIFFGLTTFIHGGWDFLLARRTAKLESATFDSSYVSPWREFLRYIGDPKTGQKFLIAMLLLAFCAVAPIVLGWGSISGGLMLVALIVLVALGLNFHEYRSTNQKKRLESGSEIPTRDLPSCETFELDANLDETKRITTVSEFGGSERSVTAQFASPPPSVTEATTKPLMSLSETSDPADNKELEG